MKISKFLLLIVFSAILITACTKEPVCGNSELEEGETPATCCLDAGCIGDQVCVNNTCKEPECGECQYVDSEKHVCVDYDCCDDSECSDDEECSDHECEKIICGSCEFIEDHKCKSLACCEDSDCNDYNEKTIDLCKFPGTKSAECTHEVADECSSDEDCDDNNNSTADSCSFGTPRVCRNIVITTCRDGDGFCPEDCNYKDDDDCEIEKIECDDDDIDCFNDALDDCLIAELEWTVESNNDTVDMEITTFMSIEGENNDNECEVFFKTKKVELEFTSDYIDELQGNSYNYTEEEVEDLESEAQDDADDVEGYDWTCYFDDCDDLISLLHSWEIGDYDITDFESYDCEGDYFD